MDSPNLDDDIRKNEIFNHFAHQDVFNKNMEARKSNSLNDLILVRPRKVGGGYRNVESKVKHYIANLPAPEHGTAAKRKIFKKHTSMPGYSGSILAGECGTTAHSSNECLSSCMKLEQEFLNFKRQSDETIKELRSQLDVSVSVISEVNMEKIDLLDRIERIRLEGVQDIKPTPESSSFNPIQMLKTVCTPKKVIPVSRNRMKLNDTAGSFLGFEPISTATAVVPTNEVELSEFTPSSQDPLRKRNLSFSSTGNSRRSGGTDSGINTSEDNEAAVPTPSPILTQGGKTRPKRKFLKGLTRLMICCGRPKKHKAQRSYKRM